MRLSQIMSKGDISVIQMQLTEIQTESGGKRLVLVTGLIAHSNAQRRQGFKFSAQVKVGISIKYIDVIHSYADIALKH